MCTELPGTQQPSVKQSTLLWLMTWRLFILEAQNSQTRHHTTIRIAYTFTIYHSGHIVVMYIALWLLELFCMANKPLFLLCYMGVMYSVYSNTTFSDEVKSSGSM